VTVGQKRFVDRAAERLSLLVTFGLITNLQLAAVPLPSPWFAPGDANGDIPLTGPLPTLWLD
jgi:hypothetical protein